VISAITGPSFGRGRACLVLVVCLSSACGCISAASHPREGSLLEGIPAGTQTRPSRETASSVMVVARGTGTLTCGGQTFELHPNDVAAIPAWTWHQLTTTGHELVVFRMTDRPIHDAFGLYRTEATDTSTSPPDPSSAGGRQDPPPAVPRCHGRRSRLGGPRDGRPDHAGMVK